MPKLNHITAIALEPDNKFQYCDLNGTCFVTTD